MFSAVCQEPVSGKPASSIRSVALEPFSPVWEKVPVSPIQSEWACADALRCASIFSGASPSAARSSLIEATRRCSSSVAISVPWADPA